MKNVAFCLLIAFFLISCAIVARADEVYDICSAAYRGDIPAVEKLLAANPELIKARSKIFGKTPIHYAAGVGNVDMIRFLLTRGAAANDRDNFGNTPLHEAANYGQNGAAEFLLSSGGDINSKTTIGWTPLHYAAAYAQKDMAAFLIERGADVTMKDESGATPLHIAAENGSIAVAYELLQHGVNVNIRTDIHELTPLHSAVIGGKKDMVEFLILNGADVNAKDHGGETPLSWAYRSKSADMINLLRKYEKPPQ